VGPVDKAMFSVDGVVLPVMSSCRDFGIFGVF